MSLRVWEKLDPLRRNYVRLLSPDGKVEDVWRNHLEAALEAFDTPYQIFRSQKDWNLFLEGQKDIASGWALRNTVTANDREFLAALKIAWEPETMRHARWRTSHGHDDDFLYEIGNVLATSFQALSPERQDAARKHMYEQATGKSYRPYRRRTRGC
jgi:hypothetical protein